MALDKSKTIKLLSYDFMNKNYIFETESGLFSHEKIDFATSFLLEVLAKQSLSGRILDLGCGYGVIGITLGGIFKLEIVLSDCNPKAVNLANKNAKTNGVTVKSVLSDGYAEIDGDFNIIITNPPIHAGKSVIYNFFEGAVTRLRPNGALYVVMLKKHGAKSAMSKLGALFSSLEIIAHKKGVFVMRATN